MVRIQEYAKHTYVDVSYIPINLYLIGFGLDPTHRDLFIF